MRSLEQRACTAGELAHERAVVVIAGDNGVHYGGDAERCVDWKAEANRRLEEVEAEMDREPEEDREEK